MIELCDFFDVMDKLEENNFLNRSSIWQPNANLTRRDAFHRRPENVIAEVPAVDADVEAVETNQYVKSELFALPIKTFRYQWITQSTIKNLSPHRLHLTLKGSALSSEFHRRSQQRQTLRLFSCSG